MSLFKVLRCNGCCRNKLVFPKMMSYWRILKIAKENGWLIKKSHHLCPECRAELEV